MLTQAMPALVNAMSGSMPQNAMRQLMQVLGNCNQPLEHRGPVAISTNARQSERGVYDGNRWDPNQFQNIANGPSIFNNNAFVDSSVNNRFFGGDEFLFKSNNEFITNNLFQTIIWGTPGGPVFPGFPGFPGGPSGPGRDGSDGRDGIGIGIGIGIPGRPGESGRAGRDGAAGAPGQDGFPGGLFRQGGYELVAGPRLDRTFFDTVAKPKCIEISRKYRLTYESKYYRYENFEFDPETCQLTYDEEECNSKQCVEVELCEESQEECDINAAAPFSEGEPRVRALLSEDPEADCNTDGLCGCDLELNFRLTGDDVWEIKRNPTPLTVFGQPTLRPKPSWP
jgi:hypothetical protein